MTTMLENTCSYYNNMPIHIAFCVNNAYVPYITVTLMSIAENHKDDEVIVHVFSDFISQKQKQRLNKVVNPYSNLTLSIQIVNDSALRGLKDTWTIYTWYRVLLPQYLSSETHRVLYLDADTIVAGNIRELFFMDMSDKAIACVVDPESFNSETYSRLKYDSSKKYVCAGVMLMNLDYWRAKDLSRTIIEWGYQHNEIIRFPDQDTINYLCRDTKIILPLRYGIMDYFFKNDFFYKEPYAQELRDCIEHPAIIHYAGMNPWKRELATSLLQDEWEKYNKMLPHPVKKEYITKGWNLVKMFIWNILHPSPKASTLTREDVLKKLNSCR